MEVGVWDQVRPYEFEHFGGISAVLDEHIGLVQSLDEMGFDNYWTIEHHSSYIGGIGSPSVWLASLARETQRIRLGAMIWIVPLHNPMRLAEEVALLDQLSHGRVEFGAGIGIHEHEFLRWGQDFYARQAMGEEAMEIVREAWTGASVTYAGRYWTFDEALPMPTPCQRPHPPIWAAVHSPRSIEWAARNNFHMAMNIDTDADMAGKFKLFRELWEGSGHLGPRPRQFLMRHVHVSDTDEKALDEAAPYLLRTWNLGREMVTSTRVGMGVSPRGVGREDSESIRARGRVFQESARSVDFWLDNGLAHIGSPETVAARIIASQQALGFTQFVACFHIGAMPPAQVARSARMFGERVLPRLR